MDFHYNAGEGMSNAIENIPAQICSNGSSRRRSASNEDSNSSTSVKRRRTDPTLDKNSTHDSAGVKFALHGTIYQSKILMLFVKRAVRENYDFRLATEMVSAEKFDDVVFKWNDVSSTPNGWRWRFLQAKHKMVPEKKKIRYSDLVLSGDSDFSLQKYFFSFCKIKQHKDFKNGILYEFDIITNTYIDFDDLTKNNWQFIFEEDSSERNLETDKMLHFELSNFKAKKFKLNKRLLPDFIQFFVDSILRCAKNTLQSLTKSVDNLKKTPKSKNDVLKLAKLVLKLKPAIEDTFEELDRSVIELEKAKKGNVKNAKEMVVNNIQKCLSNIKISFSRIQNEQSECKNSEKNPFEHLSILHLTVDSNSNCLRETVTEFVEKFRIVTNFPNEIELSENIQKELGDQFHLLNADLVTSSFEKEMIDFLKKIDKNHQSYFFSWKDADTFFESMEQNISTLMVSGLSMSYPEKIRSYGIEFEDRNEQVHSFLSQNKNQLLHISTSSSRLSTIKVLASLEHYEIYNNYDSYICLRSRTLLLNQTQTFALKAFASKKNSNLIIIESQNKNMDKNRREYQLIFDKLFAIIDENHSKRVILIDNENMIANIIESKIQIFLQIKDQSTFKDLSEKSKDSILKKTVKFQGTDIELNEIINNIAADKIIDESVLVMLIEVENVSIGNESAFISNNYVEDYYIDRTFSPIIEAKEGINRLNGELNEQLFNCDEDIEPDELTEEDPENIQEHDKDSEKTESDTSVEDFSEDEMIYRENQMILIANDAGMGKSTVLTSLALLMRDELNKWVIRINLNDYAIDESHAFSLHNINLQANDVENAIEFVMKMVMFNDIDISQFQQKLLKFCLMMCNSTAVSEFELPKIVLIFDGFDEISPNYKPKTTKLIRALHMSNANQIWVTTRNEEKNHLQVELNASVFALNPFNEYDQKKYLDSFFIWYLKFHKDAITGNIRERTMNEIMGILCDLHLPDSELESNILTILRKRFDPYYVYRMSDLIEDIDDLQFSDYAQQWFEDDEETFSYVPLHLRMFTDVVCEKKFQLPSKFGHSNLYDEYIKIKMDIFEREKTTANVDNQAMQGPLRLYSKVTETVHMELAVKLFFPVEYKTIEIPKSGEQFFFPTFIEIKGGPENDTSGKKELARVGIVAIRDDRIQFIHHTFAQYFMAKYTYEYLQNSQVQKNFLVKILSERNYAAVREFFNGFLKNGIEKDIKLHEDVKEAIVKHIESSGRYSIFFLLAYEGHSNILDFILRYIEVHERIFELFILSLSEQGTSALEFAIISNSIEIVKVLLKYSLKATALVRERILSLEYKCNSNMNALSLSAYEGHYKIMLIILNFIRDNFEEDFLNKTILATDSSGDTVLHCAAYNEQKKTLNELVKWLMNPNQMNILQKLIWKTNYIGENGLFSILNTESEFFEKQIDLLSICNVISTLQIGEDLHTLLIVTTYGGDDPKLIASNLLTIQNRFTYQSPPIQTTIKSTIETIDSIKNIRDDFHNALEMNNVQECLQILTNSQKYIRELVLINRNDCTILHEAVDKNQLEIVKEILKSVSNYPIILMELLQKGEQKNWKTVLHLAAFYGNEQIISTILNFANVHLGKDVLKNFLLRKFKRGVSAVRMAHMKKHHKTLSLLIKFELEYMPEILEEQLLEIGGIPEASKKYYSENDLELLMKYLNQATLFVALKSGNVTNLNKFLQKEVPDNDSLSKLLWIKNDLSVLSSAKPNCVCILLNWMKERFEYDPNILGKLVSTCNEDTIVDIDFLTWIKTNLETDLPGKVRQLLMKRDPSKKWKTPLNSVISRPRATIKAFLEWLKNNLDTESFADIILAVDYSGETVLHSIARSSHKNRRKDIFDDLLSILQDHPDILDKLVLFLNEKEQSALEIFEKNVTMSEISDIKYDNEYICTFLKNKYIEIVHSMLTRDQNSFLGLRIERIQALIHIIEQHLDIENKEEIIQRLEQIIDELNNPILSVPD